jgi:hypothetical protein
MKEKEWIKVDTNGQVIKQIEAIDDNMLIVLTEKGELLYKIFTKKGVK